MGKQLSILENDDDDGCSLYAGCKRYNKASQNHLNLLFGPEDARFINHIAKKYWSWYGTENSDKHPLKSHCETTQAEWNAPKTIMR